MLLSQGLELLELKTQRIVLLNGYGSRRLTIKTQVYIQFVIGDGCFEQDFLVYGQLIESLLTDPNFLQEYGLVVNFKTA
jgi:hypothetical protein